MARGVDSKTEVGQARRSSGAVGIEGKEASQSITAKLQAAEPKKEASLFGRLRKKAVTLLAAGAIALSPAALAACASDPIDYRPPAEPMKTQVDRNLDKVKYQINSNSVTTGFVGASKDPKEFATETEGVGSKKVSAGDLPQSTVEFIGEDRENSFEVQGFRIKVENPLPPRKYSEEEVEDAKEKLEDDRGGAYSRAVVETNGTRSPVELIVGLADLESISGRNLASGYWIGNNPLFSVKGILQDGTWQSAYLDQPIQLAKGQQYIISVIYSDKGEIDNSGDYWSKDMLAAQIPVTFEKE